MSNEASKIRAQCARKYGCQISTLKKKIKALTEQAQEREAVLADYNNMRREYVKLLIYCGLTDKEKEQVFESARVTESYADILKKYAGTIALARSNVFSQLMSTSCKTGDLEKAMDVVLAPLSSYLPASEGEGETEG